MNIRTFFLAQGQLIGDVVDEQSSGGKLTRVRVRNPAVIVNNGQSFQFVPLAQTVEDKEFDLNPNQLLMDGSYEPIVPIANKYREIFGSGIQVVGAMP